MSSLRGPLALCCHLVVLSTLSMLFPGFLSLCPAAAARGCQPVSGCSHKHNIHCWGSLIGGHNGCAGEPFVRCCCPAVWSYVVRGVGILRCRLPQACVVLRSGSSFVSAPVDGLSFSYSPVTRTLFQHVRYNSGF